MSESNIEWTGKVDLINNPKKPNNMNHEEQNAENNLQKNEKKETRNIKAVLTKSWPFLTLWDLDKMHRWGVEYLFDSFADSNATVPYHLAFQICKYVEFRNRALLIGGASPEKDAHLYGLNQGVILSLWVQLSVLGYLVEEVPFPLTTGAISAAQTDSISETDAQ